MKSLSFDLQWIRSATIVPLLVFITLLDQSEPKSHIRHLHSGSTYYRTRTTRADKITNGNTNYSAPSLAHSDEVQQLYSDQHVQLTLHCDVNINVTTNIWLKNGQIVQTIPMESRNRISGHRYYLDVLGSLLIDTVRLEDDGQWQCEAEDAAGFVVAANPLHLIVLDPPKKPYLLIDNRILDPGNLFIPVKENSQLTISCIVDGGNPRPTLSWELNLGSLSLQTLDAPDLSSKALNFSEVAHEQVAGARSDVHLDHVMRTHHNATITCSAQHMTLKTPTNVSLLLDVQYTPSFAISRTPGFGFPIREGMPVSLRCEVDANPRAVPVWQKDDNEPPVQQTPDGYLNFTAINRDHSGWYKCIARHFLGRFSSIGYFLNVRYEDVTSEPDYDVRELSSTGRQIEVALGGNVHLQCAAGSVGCWARLNSKTGILDPMGASQDLKIEQILYQEAGEYKCVTPSHDSRKSLNHLRVSSNVDVVVKGAPVVYPNNQTITTNVGQTLTLAVEFCSNPDYTRVIWMVLRANVALMPGQVHDRISAYEITNSSSANCHNAALSLRSVSVSDSGEYIFYVRSPSGLAEGIYNVNVTQTSEYTINEAVPHFYNHRIYIMLLYTTIIILYVNSIQILVRF